MMNNVTNPYDALYTNLKNQFTVVEDGCECTVGEYMLKKAGKKNDAQNTLAVTATVNSQRSVATIVDYFNDKLTVKAPVLKEKTIKKFPIRTSASAMLSAVAACALVFSYGIFAITGLKAPSTAEAPEYSETEEFDEEESKNPEMENIKYEENI